MKTVAILDNTVLANFLDAGKIELLLKLQVVFSHFLIPVKVKQELLNVAPSYLLKRQVFANYINSDNYGFYRLCTTHDLIILGIAESLFSKGIHSGEAEAIAQARKQNVKFFFTDDQDCSDIIRKEFFWLYPMTTHSLIAILDVTGLLIDPVETWRTFHKTSRFNFKQLKNAFSNAFFILDIRDKSLLQEKSSWKRIFGHRHRNK